jgi:trigger factor
MKFKKSNTKSSEIKVVVSFDDKQIQSYTEYAAKELGKTIEMKGFRKGHVPTNIVEEQYGKDVLVEYALEKKLNNIYQEVLTENKIEPIAQPSVEFTSKDPVEITFVIAVKPEIDLKPLDKIKLKKTEAKVTKKEVDEEIGHMLSKAAKFEEVDRASKQGDRVSVDFEGFDKDGKSIPNTKSANHPIVIGDKMFIPGFEENLVGLKKDAEHEFEVTFPKDYHAKELAAAKVTFKIKVNKIENKIEAQLDEETIEKISYKKQTKAEFEKEVKERLENKKESEAKKEVEEKLYDEFLKNLKFELSELVINDEMYILKQELAQNLQRQGLTLEQYEKMMSDKEGKSINETYKTQAEERAKLKLIIDAIVTAKKLEITDADVDAKLKQEVDKAPEEIKEHVEKYYRENAQALAVLKNSMLLDKLVAEYIS